jgi:hypothetical protein
MFGDPNQLPPYVVKADGHGGAPSFLDTFTTSVSERAECIKATTQLPSVFARLIALYCCERYSSFDPVHVMLDTQYRMNKHLGNMISRVFYAGLLSSHDQSPTRGVCWIDSTGIPEVQNHSTFNRDEALCIYDIWKSETKRLNSVHPLEVVVICMYEAQRRYISATWGREGLRAFNVDSFQGQEAVVVILSLAAQSPTDFLLDPHRINVACSRAKERLYIVGSELIGKYVPRDLFDEKRHWNWIYNYVKLDERIAQRRLRDAEKKQKKLALEHQKHIDRQLASGNRQPGQELTQKAVALWTIQKLLAGLSGPAFLQEVKEFLGPHVNPMQPILLALTAKLVVTDDGNQPSKVASAMRLMEMHPSIRDCIFAENTLKKAVKSLLGLSLRASQKFDRLNRSEFDLYLQHTQTGDSNALRQLIELASRRGTTSISGSVG